MIDQTVEPASAAAGAPDALVTVCIPTCNRTALLKLALSSCLEQDYRPLQILIGDDSSDNETARWIETVVAPPGVSIDYRRNSPRLGQAGNVNDLFERASGARLVLLHDDDTLTPGAISRLANCWQAHRELTAAFGKQYLITHEGKRLEAESEVLNRDYFRTPDAAGLQATPANAGILRMFPNDAFMVRSEMARRIAYRSPELVGDACDFDFGLRLCVEAESVFFVNEYVAEYRLTDASISRNAHPAAFNYTLLESLNVPQASQAARARAMAAVAPLAASAFARAGNAGKALQIICSRHYRMRDRLKARFVLHLWLLSRALLRQVFGGNTASPDRRSAS
ncbi:glycosyltransferase family 2 protein [Paraburkholderia antibiotica]|uniref:Glycosyltransferase family 2 protein n=1 Tax=Paraburkholderia antibiotica TaxID=2728839 RepID=A0A7X9X3B3_9BURK|nr:glycosyltransferase family 2 protein [Paraburkholderia antibiotica]NML30469.1 glycosyltransferase family 2 protein [Paraburkholderia antibiotica]